MQKIIVAVLFVVVFCQTTFSQDSSRISPIITLENQASNAPFRLLQLRLDSLQAELNLQKRFLDQSKEYSRETLEYANTVISWSSYILAAFGALALIGGFFGVRNMQKAMELRRQLESEINEFKGKGSTIVHTIYWLVEAKSAYATGNFQKAIDFYLQVIKVAPDYIEAYLRSAWAYFALDDPETALRMSAEAEEMAHTDKEKYWYEVLNIVAYAKLGNREKAEAAFERAVKYDPQSPVAFRLSGFASILLGDFSMAAVRLKTALDQKKDMDKGTHFLGGCILFHEGRIDESRKLFNKTFDLAKNEFYSKDDALLPYLYMGLSLLAKGEKEKGIKVLKDSIGKKDGFETLDYLLHALNLLKETDNPPENIDYALDFIKNLKNKTGNHRLPESLIEVLDSET